MSRDDDDEEEHHSFEKWKINQKFSLDRWMDRLQQVAIQIILSSLKNSLTSG